MHAEKTSVICLFFSLGGVHSQDAGAGLSQIDLEACELRISPHKIRNVNVLICKKHSKIAQCNPKF